MLPDKRELCTYDGLSDLSGSLRVCKYRNYCLCMQTKCYLFSKIIYFVVCLLRYDMAIILRFSLSRVRFLNAQVTNNERVTLTGK